MSDTIENGIKFDRTLWPESGTVVSTMPPADLKTLWDTHPDQAAVFVAESLIRSERITANFDAENSSLEIFLWELGNDTLSISFDLKKEITSSVSTWDFTEAQADQALDIVRRLQALEDAFRDGEK